MSKCRELLDKLHEAVRPNKLKKLVSELLDIVKDGDILVKDKQDGFEIIIEDEQGNKLGNIKVDNNSDNIISINLNKDIKPKIMKLLDKLKIK